MFPEIGSITPPPQFMISPFGDNSPFMEGLGTIPIGHPLTHHESVPLRSISSYQNHSVITSNRHYVT